jgi:plasmid maintenance system antidote protein VapI
MPRKLKAVTPGELLRKEFLLPLGITKYRVAKEIGVWQSFRTTTRR